MIRRCFNDSGLPWQRARGGWPPPRRPASVSGTRGWRWRAGAEHPAAILVDTGRDSGMNFCMRAFVCFILSSLASFLPSSSEGSLPTVLFLKRKSGHSRLKLLSNPYLVVFITSPFMESSYASNTYLHCNDTSNVSRERAFKPDKTTSNERRSCHSPRFTY